ncbi:hypothetical protein HMSSN036_51750 [Paenibacillus macerans]|nr:hypothetical protein HMSSN036_51750 [Paenibacillus macerans]
MNLHMSEWIKAKDDFVSILALEIVGGYSANGKFHFKSAIHRNEFDRIRRDLQKKNDRCANSDHTPLK